MKLNPSKDSLIERCKRICGDEKNQCIIDTPSQMACIADMVINKTFGISLMLKHALSTQSVEEAKEYIELALGNSGELSNWVKYLQVASDLRDLLALGSGPGEDKRREMRYPLPESCRQYIVLQAAPGDETVEMVLHNFSQSGFQASSPRPFANNDLLECSLRLTQKTDKWVKLSARVRYCEPVGDAFLIGAAIEDVSDSMDFNFFNDVFSLIMELSAPRPEGQP